MNGVEILTSKTIYNTMLPGWCVEISIIFAIVFGIIALYFAGQRKLMQYIICCVLVACATSVAIFGSIKNNDSIDYIEYKVTIDETTLMTEFVSKYEILDKEGNIYTIKEKE